MYAEDHLGWTSCNAYVMCMSAATLQTAPKCWPVLPQPEPHLGTRIDDVAVSRASEALTAGSIQRCTAASH